VVRLPLCFLALLTACGDDVGASDAGDAGVDGDAGGEPIAEAALPILTPCPTGWRTASMDDGMMVCEPYEGEAPVTCAEGQVHLPGQPGCAPLDAPCPTGDFADDLPSGARILYVRPGETGGDGSLTTPYGTIAEALPGATDGDVIALAKGRYDELVRLSAGVTVHGACSTGTVLTSSVSIGVGGVIEVGSPGAAVKRVRFDDATRPAVVVDPGGSLSLENVLVTRAGEVGVVVDGGAITADGLGIEGIRPAADGRFGRGIDVRGGGSFEGRRVSVVRTQDLGVHAEHEGSHVSLSDFVVYETAVEEASRDFGIGVQVNDGANATLDRGLVGGSGTAGILSTRAASVSVTQVVIRDGRGRESDGLRGWGISVQEGSSVTASKLLIDRATETGLLVSGLRGSLVLEDVAIVDTRSDLLGVGRGHGLAVDHGAVAELRRVLFLRTREVGVVVIRPDSRLTATDLTIRQTQPDAAGGAGFALLGTRGASIEVDRGLISEAFDVGVFGTAEGTRITLTDTIVEDIDSRPIDGRYGRGVDIESGTMLTMLRSTVRRVRNVGVFVGSTEATATLDGVTVENVDFERCAEAGCTTGDVAVGVGSYAESRMNVRDFTITDARLCGVQVGPRGELDLDGGEVSGCTIGACVVAEPFDIGRLMENVRYRDNGTNLEVSGALPVPDLAPEPPSD